MSPCRFGKKVSTEGPTPKARSYNSTIEKWRKNNDGMLRNLKGLTAHNRVFRTHGHFYFPYSFMTSDFLGVSAPLDSKWVPEDQITTELLGRICTHQARSLMGGIINDYQNKEVPKFITDLKRYYPKIFAILPENQKSRLRDINYVGRQAELLTCPPGLYTFGSNIWEWDGTVLRGSSMLFSPVPGDISITIKPAPGASVKITSNDQVTESTRFLD